MKGPQENTTVTPPQGPQEQSKTFDDVETVEIKVTIRPDQALKASRAMQVHEDTADVCVLYFFDTPNLTLLDAGVVLCARLRSGEDDDSVVRFRRVDVGRIDRSWTFFEGFALDAECVGDEVIPRASLRVLQRRDDIDTVADRKRPIETVFSREQERFLGQFCGERIEFANLRVLGPIRQLRWQLEHSEFPHPLAVEEWRLPDGDDLVEVSMTAPAELAASARREFTRHLDALGLDPQGDHQSKTRVALAFFTGL